MQDARAKYAVNSTYDVTTTSETIITAHESKRAEYEAYIAKMFSARAAAKAAYDALEPEQQSQISAELVAKLDDTLDTVFYSDTYAVTPSNNAYTFEAVDDDVQGSFCYEASAHLTSSKQTPMIFALVDTSDGKTSWTPSGRYEYGKSNFDVTYCCDVSTALEFGTHYKRINLEDSNYYGPNAAKHIRAILQSSYPFVSMEQMIKNLKASGFDAEVADQLNRADAIAAVQMAIWAYANAGEEDLVGNNAYGATFDLTGGRKYYYGPDPMHDYKNEMWTWWTTSTGNRSYDARTAYRVNNLVYHLCTLKGVEAEEVAISKVQVTRADLIPDGTGQYRVGMYIYLNGGDANDDLKVYIESSDAAGNVTARSNQVVAGRTELEMSVKANIGDTIKVTVDGTQNLEKDVYFYEPEAEEGKTARETSQCLVGVAEGDTKVHAEESFKFEENVTETGLRIHKTAEGTGLPISDITFDVYKVEVAEGESLSEAPTTAEIEKYATEANKVASMTTDATGYTSTELKEGKYLVIEQNSDKVVEPVAPFYIQIPMTVTKGEGEGTTVETLKIVSLYPKNTPVTPPDNPPDLPTPPDNVTGQFIIEKYNELNPNQKLNGAVFEVYRAATEEDADTKIIVCEGVQYAVVPVLVNGEHLILTTGEDGRVTSPELPCITYFLVETEAPDGFNLAGEAFTVTVISSVTGETVVAEIPNAPGNILPETGGIGTTIFYVLGGLLAVGAGVLLIAKKRMDDDK